MSLLYVIYLKIFIKLSLNGLSATNLIVICRCCTVSRDVTICVRYVTVLCVLRSSKKLALPLIFTCSDLQFVPRRIIYSLSERKADASICVKKSYN
jgi:hypothetical protein